MWPDWVSNSGPLALESDALPTLRHAAQRLQIDYSVCVGGGGGGKHVLPDQALTLCFCSGSKHLVYMKIGPHVDVPSFQRQI